ncbi:MAG: phenylalanine--tRNA ligase subunit alpha [Christensenellaceae bacterium]|nr:phenylalanine--tRNA ligase subunit alpha [Christensenellaceae bacterium]
MSNQNDQIRQEALEEIENAVQPRILEELKVKYIGKKGKLTELSRAMGSLSPEERPAFGQKLNNLRKQLEEAFEKKEKEIKDRLLSERLESERIDVTIPAPAAQTGSLHPLSIVRNELIEIFVRMGFDVAEGPEVETDYYNFQALNIPQDHPARDMQDTFYVTDSLLLRSQTSAMQIRTMEKQKPPIRIICPGRVFRADEADATHSPIFHQMEGLVVDKGITMCDLKSTLDIFAREVYGSDAKTKLRPSYFPFTEPSVEVDVTCSECSGKGCRVCKGSGWVEILGAGMVNPKVLAGCGIDPAVYSGFAFGMGIDRIALTRYKISDMRIMFENDVRFLEQFK